MYKCECFPNGVIKKKFINQQETMNLYSKFNRNLATYFLNILESSRVVFKGKF